MRMFEFENLIDDDQLTKIRSAGWYFSSTKVATNPPRKYTIPPLDILVLSAPFFNPKAPPFLVAVYDNPRGGRFTVSRYPVPWLPVLKSLLLWTGTPDHDKSINQAR